jgi:transcriptional regulator with XRE-family HTH domain
MLLVARHKAHKNTSECARACELSPSFLNRIEAGLRTPELERCPAIANAYGIPADVLCWTWIVAWAPSAVPHLATSIDFEANPTMVEYLRGQYARQQAVEEARKSEKNALRAEQKLRAAEKRAEQNLRAAEKEGARLAARATDKQAQEGWGEWIGGPSPAGPDFNSGNVQVAELDVTHSPLNPLLPSGIGTGTHKPKT